MTILRPAALAALVILAPPALSAQAPATPIVVPFTIDGNDMIRLPVTLGDTSYSFIFDTGAGIDVLAPSAVAALHGTPAGWLDAVRMTGELLHIELFRIPRMVVGTLERRDVIVGRSDFLEPLGIKGILSLNGFRDRAVTLDLAANVLTVETPRSLAGRRATGTVLPLAVDDLRGLSVDIFANFLLGGERGQCSIDTGSQGSTLSTRLLGPLGIDSTGPNVHVRRSTTVGGATQVRYVAGIPGIALASAPDLRAPASAVTFSDIIYDCVVGLDWWKGRTLTIDIAARDLIVGKSDR